MVLFVQNVDSNLKKKKKNKWPFDRGLELNFKWIVQPFFMMVQLFFFLKKNLIFNIFYVTNNFP